MNHWPYNLILRTKKIKTMASKTNAKTPLPVPLERDIENIARVISAMLIKPFACTLFL